MLAPPGPGGWQLVSLLPRLWWDIPSFQTALAKRYGDMVRYRIGRHTFYLICHPDHLAQLFEHETQGHYTKASHNRSLEPIFGHTIFHANGEEWGRRRRLLQPLFTKSYVRRWIPLIATATAGRLAQYWEPRARSAVPIELRSEMAVLLRRIVAPMFFGVTGESTEAARAFEAIKAMSDGLVNTILMSHVFGRFAKHLPLVKQQVASSQRVHAFIKTCSLSSHSLPDEERQAVMLGWIGDAQDPKTGKGLTERELQDEMVALFLAANETTITALAWTLYFIARDRHVAERICEEIDAILGHTERISDETISKLTYTAAVIQESLRLRPPAYVYARAVARADRIGGYDIAAGASMIVSPYLTHRHSGYWTDPETFEPDRFLKPEANTGFRYAYHPFAGGQRGCLGKHLAMLEMTTIVTTILQSYELHLSSETPVGYQALMTLRPARPIAVIARLRR